MKKTIVSLLAVSLALLSTPASNASQSFKTCKELNKVYKYGVGLEGAKNMVKSRATGVIQPKASKHFVDAALYEANKKSDSDNDKIACEK
jgi:hypothetical protein